MMDSNNGNTAPIFPCVGYEQDGPKPASTSNNCLFPVYADQETNDAEKADNLHKADSKLDWLENSSFKSEHVAVLHKLSQADRSSSLDKNEIVEISDEESEGKSLKRRNSSDDDSDDYRKRRSKQKHKKHKHKKHKKKEKKNDKTDRDIRRESSKNANAHNDEKLKELPSTSGKVFIEDMHGLIVEHAYRIDRKPDRLNLTYGELYKHHIARYRKFRYGILGYGGALDQLFDYSKKRRARRLEAPRFFADEVARRLKSDENVIDLSADKTRMASEKGGKFHERSDAAEDVAELFLPLETKINEKSSVDEKSSASMNPLGVYDAGTELYIQGKPLKQPHAEEEIEAVTVDTSVIEGLKETRDQFIRRKTTEYNKHLRLNVGDVATWLEFVEFQDELDADNYKTMTTAATKDERNSRRRLSAIRVEKKVAIIDRAIESNPGSVDLRLARLELCDDVWNYEQLSKEWDRLLFHHVNSIEMWRRYLKFTQSRMQTFSLSTMLKTYQKCLSTLIQLYDGKLRSHTLPVNLENHILDILVELCWKLKQAGQSEKAVSIMQAILEFNLRCPASLRNSTAEERAAVFEVFWDSCVPRIGENGAVGWSAWMADKLQQFPAPTTSAVEDDMDEIAEHGGVDLANLWLKVETARENHAWFPWRPNILLGEGQDDCEDPDRVVLFDDIAAFLITFPKTLHLNIVSSFLELLGFSDRNEVTSPSSKCENFLQHFERTLEKPNHIINSGNLDIRLADFPMSEPVFNHEFMKNVFEFALKSSLAPCDQYCLTRMLLRYNVVYLGRCQRDRSGDQKHLKLLRKDTKKLIKSVLSENRNDLDLWTFYAQFEWYIGSVTESTKVFDTAISMNCPTWSESLVEADKKSVCHIYRIYCDCLLGLNRFSLSGRDYLKQPIEFMTKEPLREDLRDRVVYLSACLSGSCDFVNPSVSQRCVGPAILKTRKAYAQTLEKAFENFEDRMTSMYSRTVDDFKQSAEIVLDLSYCYALFQYFTVGVHALRIAFESGFDRLKALKSEKIADDDTNSIFHRTQESLYIRYIRLLQCHMKWTVCSLSVLRTGVRQALEEFPDNPTLLQCLVTIDCSGHLVSGLRRYFDEHARHSRSVFHWFYRIYTELQRLHDTESEATMGTGTVHRIGALFQRATDSNTGRYCLLLWRMYMAFQVKHGQNNEAKGVFYKALQNCPWAKVLYLDAVSYFPDDLQDVVDLIVEKELRLRALPEELEILTEKPVHQTDSENLTSVPENMEASLHPTSVSEDLETVVHPTFVSEDLETVVHQTSVSEDKETVVHLTSMTRPNDQSDVVHPISLTKDQETVVHPTLVSEDQENVVHKTSVSNNQENVVHQTAMSDNQENVVHQTAMSDNQENVVHQTAMPDNQEIVSNVL
ncbi:nuclear exosome regulator NRDE2-like isoform X2 [Tubulanus polymorphus]|uniref:nuclear exosome regulator NRDE2-like isoform X2 n=1 Tax=Tubulanus polymorphus TaxID=672921 RepID=UPI003DA2CDD9